MLNNNSESDESLENMKLDLIKAKYAHQKLKNSDSNFSSQFKFNKINSNKIHNGHDKIKTSYINTDVVNPKSSHSPLMSNRKAAKINTAIPNLNSIENNPETYYGDSEEDNEDEADMDINKINDYVDYLLTKKKISLTEDKTNDIIETPLTMFQDPSSSISKFSTTGAYQKCNRDCIPNTESTDILAQWRLRRKMNEAENSVRMDYQRHDLRIHSLNSQTKENCQFLLNKPSICFSNNISTINKTNQSNKLEDCDQVPVRDVINEKSFSSSINKDEVKQIPFTADASCQCQLNQPNLIKTTKKIHAVKTSRKTRNVAVMTNLKHSNASKLIDDSTQTENNSNDSINSIIVNRSTEWDDKNVGHDYIDRAIEKTLQSQLFDRNYSPAMSTITSINESQNNDVTVQKNPQDLCIEDNNRKIVNNDSFCEELPWNDKFDIDSDNEFQYDNLLMDLRKKREINLQKLRNLSAKIQNCKSRYLATINSC